MLIGYFDEVDHERTGIAKVMLIPRHSHNIELHTRADEARVLTNSPGSFAITIWRTHHTKHAKPHAHTHTHDSFNCFHRARDSNRKLPFARQHTAPHNRHTRASPSIRTGKINFGGACEHESAQTQHDTLIKRQPLKIEQCSRHIHETWSWWGGGKKGVWEGSVRGHRHDETHRVFSLLVSFFMRRPERVLGKLCASDR